MRVEHGLVEAASAPISLIFQLRGILFQLNAASSACWGLLEEAWEALNKTLKATDLAALSFPTDDLNRKLDGN